MGAAHTRRAAGARQPPDQPQRRWHVAQALARPLGRRERKVERQGRNRMIHGFVSSSGRLSSSTDPLCSGRQRADSRGGRAEHDEQQHTDGIEAATFGRLSSNDSRTDTETQTKRTRERPDECCSPILHAFGGIRPALHRQG